MNPRTREFARIGGYVAFGVLATSFFVYQTFPLEVVQSRINKELHKSAPNLSIGFAHARPYLLSGIDARGVSLDIAKKDGSQATIDFDRVKARLNLFPLLKKRYVVDYDLVLADTSIAGSLGSGPDGSVIKLETEDLSLSDLPVAVIKMLGTKLVGTSTAKIDLALDATDTKKSTGSASLQIKKLALGDMTLRNLHPSMPGEFSLPAIDLGDINAQLEVVNGQLKIKQFTQKGADLEARITGDITLNKLAPNSALNLTVEFKLTEELIKKSPKLSALGAFLRKNSEGFASVRIGGTVANPVPML